MTINDLVEVLEIERLTFEEPWSAAAFSVELKKSLCLVAQEDKNKKIIGYIICSKIIEEGHILNIAVKHGERGKGVGRLLLEECIKILKEEGIKSIYLEVRRSNIKAIKFYQKFGFQIVGIRKNYYSNREDAFTMLRILPS